MDRDIAIVIVSWNTKEYLRGCLTSLEKYFTENKCRIIVIDNNSKDGSREMVEKEFKNVLLLNSGMNIGFSRANNAARKYIGEKYVFFLNPDTVILDESILKMIDIMEGNKDIGIVGCKMKSMDGKVHSLGLQWYSSPLTELFNIFFVSEKTINRLKSFLPYQDPNKSGFVRKLYGGAIMVRKNVLDEIGWFDERFFMYGEDVDLCRRSIEAGWKLYYMSEAQIIHLVGGASRRATNQFSTLMKCESISKLMQKYYGVKGRRLYSIGIFIGAGFRIAALMLIGAGSKIAGGSVGINHQGALRKYLAMIKWSLKLQKAMIRT